MSNDEFYQNSTCFSNSAVTNLNCLAFQLNQSLFFFAYYEPKSYSSGESYFSLFRTAVTNLYGLFKDCGPHVYYLLRGHNSILLHDWSRIQRDFDSLQSIVNSFRSILCHNCSRELTLNDEHYRIVEDWMYTEIGIDSSLIELHDDHWQHMLDVIVKKTQALITDIEQSMWCLIQASDINRRNRAIQYWMEQIAEMYYKNPEYLLHTMSALYLWYVENGGNQTIINTSRSLRYQTIQWLTLCCNANHNHWYTNWLDKNSILQLVRDWPREWAQWNGRLPTDCYEPPLPGSELFRILASDVDRFATNPQNGYIG